MEQRRPNSRSQPHHRRRHYNSNLNPSANDFIPTSHYDGPAGPSHSRDNAYGDEYEEWSRDERRGPVGYGDRRNDGRDHYSHESRPNHNRPTPHNSHAAVNYPADYEARNISQGRNFHNRRSGNEFPGHVHEEPSFDYNSREPRDSHYSSNVSNYGRDQQNSYSRRFESKFNDGHSSSQNSRYNMRYNDSRYDDVRFDNNFNSQSTSYDTKGYTPFRSDSPNQNISKQNHYGNPSSSNNFRNKKPNHGRNFNSERNDDVRFDEVYHQVSNHERDNCKPFRSSDQNTTKNNNFGIYSSSRGRKQNTKTQNINFKNNKERNNGLNSAIQGAIGSVSKMSLNDSNVKNFNLDEEVTSQRDKLIQILFKGTQECLVCCERIAQAQSVWSCNKCYNILHLVCTTQWADSSLTEQGWRCPACQNVSIEVPQLYHCFCKKQVLDIGWNRSDTPHTCGEVCGKDLSRGDSPCGHRCTLLCHPGPCPVCEIVITRYCGCGQTNCQMQCGSTKVLTCSSVCGKLLNCMKHQCEAMCHEGPCQPCSQIFEQTCYCTTNSKTVVCSEGVELNYSCGGACSKDLECGNHKCTNSCHPGPCDMCYLMPQFITTCCCGKTRLPSNQKRSSCIDPIPTCSQVCGKTLHCGELEEKHKCKAQCHEGDCPPCKLNSVVLCNCKQRKRQLQCSELKPGAIVKCNVKCSTMRSCGKHKCNQTCCTTQEHICPLTCNKKLRCGTHKCEHLCHQGPCPACMNVSFEELTCRCGGEVIFPPIPCGTKRPLCGRVCSRQHPCSHPPAHGCHDEPECPPCVVFTEKWCFGHHQSRKNIFCNVSSYSCGQQCGKVLKCQRHFCILPCHEGDCLKANEKCKQVCIKSRPACGHPCNEKCHPGACPGSTCTAKIMVSCSCGERSETQACIEDKNLLEQFNKNSKGEYKILECNDLCSQIDRNRRLALGLQIRNPDLNLKLKPVYPDLLKQWAKKDPDFCNYVHSKLADLVKLSKDSKQKSRSFSFEVMNRDKRQFIHAYSEFFGINAVDCDPEPKRNVLVTAFKDKAWLPGYSLMETMHREKGQPKVPMLPNRENMAKGGRSEMVQLGGKKS